MKLRPGDRDILRLAVPAAGALAAEPLYVLTDTAIVGRLGTPQLGGLAVASTLILTVYALFVFLAYGTTGTVARLLGAGDEARAAHRGMQALWLAVGTGVVLGLVGFVLAEPAVRLMGADDDVLPHALTYLRISTFGLPALFLVLAGTGYLRGLQDTRTPLVVAVGSALANLLIELVLVFVFDLGVAGSAWSTVVSQAGAAAVYATMITRHVRAMGVSLRPDAVALRGLAVVSRDLFVRTASLRLSFTFGAAIAARIGVVDLGAHQVAFELWSFLALLLDALAIAGQALVGRLLGAGDADGARAVARRMVEWGLIGGVAFGVTVALLRHQLPQLFTDDPDVRSLTAFLLLYVAAFQPLNAVVFVLDGVLIGAGDLRFLARAMFAAALVFVPAGAAVLVLDLGIGWLWAAIAGLMTVRLVTLWVRYTGSAWLVLGAERVR